jgi:serine/threonine-protein kinase
LINKLINSRYEVLERLGEGAFFQVYKARDKATNRLAAVKVLRPEFVGDADLRLALKENAGHIISLTHANIARLYEVCEEDGNFYLITEYVRGINLKERIRRIAPFTVPVSVDFAVAIAEALYQAHQDGVLHGDLRPQNVIVSPEGIVKITDFGMAHALAASHRASVANLHNSVYYQCPEVTAAKPFTISADIYALGVILFEMVTGSVPFAGETPLIVAGRHQKEPIPSPRAMNTAVPKALEMVIVKALQKRPEDRYRSMSDMLNDLKTVRDSLRFGKPIKLPNTSLPSDITVPSDNAFASRKDKLDSLINPESPDAALVKAAEISSPAEVQQGIKNTPAAHSEADIRNGDSVMAHANYDDRVSPYIKVAIFSVLFILLATLIIGVPIWMATFAHPQEKKLPDLVGMPFDKAQQEADMVGAKLIRHDEFNSQYSKDVILRTDWLGGRIVRPGTTINVWVSRGSKTVTIPDVTNLNGDDANTKLTDAGLTLGQVTRTHSNTVALNNVISQNPTSGKIVPRDTPVSLVISDGPDLSSSNPDNSGNSTDNTSNDNGNPGNNTPDNSSANTSPDSSDTGSANIPTHVYNLSFKINADGAGTRRVRVEYDDARGTHTAVDDYYNEGDRINQNINVSGNVFTLRVYYGNSQTPVKEQTVVIPGGR